MPSGRGDGMKKRNNNRRMYREVFKITVPPTIETIVLDFTKFNENLLTWRDRAEDELQRQGYTTNFDVFVSHLIAREEAKKNASIGEPPAKLAVCRPPMLAEFVGAFFLRSELRESVVGCRAEDFAQNVTLFGRRGALAIYWRDIAASIGPQAWTWLRRLAIFGAVAEIYRRVTGL